MTTRLRALLVVASLVAIAFGLPFTGGVPAASAQTISVTSANPPSGEQGALGLEVVVGGKGFKNGAKAAFFKTGTSDPAGVSVRSTRYVSATQLVATVDIADAAALSLFDIQVKNADGRTGKGTELFKVTEKSTGPCVAVSIPVEITVVAFDVDGDGQDDSALYGDAKGATYVDGVDGVAAVIQACSGSNDLTFNLITSGVRRSLGFVFPAPIEGSVSPGPAPVWVPGAFLAKSFINFRNILWGRSNGQSTFTTRMNSGYVSPAGEKSTYHLRFAPVLNDAGIPGDPVSNQPNETTAVTVQDIPGTCRSTAGGTLDTWLITVNLPAIGALVREGKGSTEYQSGQYFMPFQLLVKAKTCLPF